jgi:hypothetical protein
MTYEITNIIVRTLKPIARVISSTFNPTANVIKNIGINQTLVPGGKLLDLSINFATYEPMFIPLGAPVFATAAVQE